MKRVSPATILSCLALFFSLGGGAFAATHYRITSIYQIKPSVRQALRGRQGPRGPAGPAGAQGAPGQVFYCQSSDVPHSVAGNNGQDNYVP